MIETVKKALIIFAKTPRPGQVKTRLQPEISPGDAVRLYEAFVRDTLSLSARIRGVDRLLACAGDQGKGSAHPFFGKIVRGSRLSLFDQSGRTLGDRMRKAMDLGFKAGFHKVVIIGTDSPTLPGAYIREAFRALDRSRVVVGPGTDGGYYLVGAAGSTPPIFSGIEWGSPRVMVQTLDRMNSGKIKPHLLPFWYDVDTMEDLRFLSRHLRVLNRGKGLKTAPKTSGVLKKLGF